MQIRLNCVLFAFALAVLSGCTTAPNTATSSPAPAAGAADGRSLAAVLDRHKRWQQKPADEQRQELAAGNEAFAKGRADADRIALALMLSTPGTAFRDDTRALALLAQPDAGNPPLAQFAQVLSQQISERLRQLKDEQKRGDEFAQKLEALRAIERSIVEREQRARVK